MKFKSYKTAPQDGNIFLAVMPGPTLDICWYDKETKCFKDYYHKQNVGYMMGWMKMPDTAGVYQKFGCGYFKDGTWTKT
jgi:hypothetical protein